MPPGGPGATPGCPVRSGAMAWTDRITTAGPAPSSPPGLAPLSGVMESNRGPTLAEAIAAGSRLLARSGADGPAQVGVPTQVAVPAPAVPVRPEAVDTVVEESPPAEVWLGAAAIATRVGRDPWTVAEHLQNGTLHGHAADGGWSVRDVVVELFLAGADPASQQRVCGCRVLRLVHDSRRRPRWRTSSGAGCGADRRILARQL